MSNYKSCLEQARHIDDNELPYILSTTEGGSSSSGVCIAHPTEFLNMLVSTLQTFGQSVMDQEGEEDKDTYASLYEELGTNTRETTLLTGIIALISAITEGGKEEFNTILFALLQSSINMYNEK